MNPLAILALVLALLVGFYIFSGAHSSFLNGNTTGPIATGSGAGSEIQNPQPVRSGGGFFGNFFSPSSNSPPPSSAPTLAPGESPYKGKVYISYIQRSGNSPNQEYISIRSSYAYTSTGSQAYAPIDITGWTVASLRSSAHIPLAFNVAEIDAAEQDIFLSSGGELIALTGTPDYTSNFRENVCTGYLNQAHVFTPALSYSCADANPDRTKLLNMGFNGACINTIASVPPCTIPQGTFQAGIIGVECVNYMVEHLSYAGCVDNFRDTKNFLKNEWRISFKLPRKLYDPTHDRIALRDQNGLLVDQFEY